MYGSTLNIRAGMLGLRLETLDRMYLTRGRLVRCPADRTVGVDAEAALLMEFKEILAEGALVAEEAHVEEGARVAEGAHVEEEVPVAGEALAVQAEKVA